MRIGITGASGFLGSAIRHEVEARGHEPAPLRLARDDSLRDRDTLRDTLALDSLDTLIHSAASLRPRSEHENYLNAQFPGELERLFHEMHPTGKFIHISTINVLIDKLVDPYTRSKRLAEKTLDPERVLLLRPSLIWSGSDQGPARRLREFLDRFPIAFMTFPGNRHLPVHVAALARAIVSLALSDRFSGVINIHGDVPVTLWQLAREFARQKQRLLLPIPAPFTSRNLPKFLRSVDYTKLCSSESPPATETLILPWQVEAQPRNDRPGEPGSIRTLGRGD
jgi:nucleoside-diphosphate-sugar epimerase